MTLFCVFVCLCLFYYFCFQKKSLIKVNYQIHRGFLSYLNYYWMLTCHALSLWLSKYYSHIQHLKKRVLLSTGADTIKIIKSKCKTIQKKHDQTVIRLLWFQMNPPYCVWNHFITLAHFTRNFLPLLFALFSENAHSKFAKIFHKAAGNRH